MKEIHSGSLGLEHLYELFYVALDQFHFNVNVCICMHSNPNTSRTTLPSHDTYLRNRYYFMHYISKKCLHYQLLLKSDAGKRKTEEVSAIQTLTLYLLLTIVAQGHQCSQDSGSPSKSSETSCHMERVMAAQWETHPRDGLP